jgi:hypothetical protein
MEVGTISFEVRIPMKKPKIFMEFFYISFRKKYLFFDSTILFWKKTKIFMETLLYRQKATEKQGFRIICKMAILRGEFMDGSCWGAISSTLIIPFRKPLNSNHISLDTF